MRAYSGVARAEKILSEEEIGTVEAIVAAVGAGRVGAQFRDATDGDTRNEKDNG